MAKNTPNYEFEKPEQNDFYDVDVQNRNWDKAETALTEFDDSGSVDEIKSFPDFLKKFVTGNKLAVTMRNLKAGMQFVLHAGQIVNNCVTDNAGLPLSAAQGKVLKDLYTQLYSDIDKKEFPFGNTLAPGDVGLNCYGYLMSRFGIDGVSTSQKGDKYYLAVSSTGQIYSGAQINGAENITWKESASKTDLPNIFTAKLGTSNQEGNHATTIKGLWNSFPEKQVFACHLVDSNNFCVFGFIYGDHKYGTVLYLAYNDCGIVKCNNGTFSDTKL